MSAHCAVESARQRRGRRHGRRRRPRGERRGPLGLGPPAARRCLRAFAPRGPPRYLRRPGGDPAHAGARGRRRREADYSWAELAALSDLGASLGVELDREISRAATGDGALAAKLARYRALPEQLGADLDAGRVDLRTAEQLAAHAADQACDAVARAERLSFSKRRQLLRLAVETLRREQQRPRQSRGSSSVLSLVDLIDDAMAHPDPVSAISKRRYPSFTELSDRLDAIRVETIEKSGVELSEPPYFEGERYTVQFSFANGEELERRIAALERLKSRTRELQDLL